MTAAAIFVKTPGHSPLKTRLAATLGQDRTEALYLECAAAVSAAARAADLEAVYWATAESSATVGDGWPGLPLIDQGDGGLGERMARVMATLVDRHGSGLLLGADAPQLDAAVLARAADWLEADGPRRVIGPAADGGFWTFGSNQAIAPSRWTTVAYSRPDTLQRFRQAMGDDARWLDLPRLTDLDTAEDLRPVAGELLRLQDARPEQTTLAAKLEDAAGGLKPET